MDFEDGYDSDDDWFYNSIKRYDDLLIYEFQGKVSSTCFLTENKFVATCLNLNGKHEVLELSVPDRLLATKDVGLMKNRDFSFISAGYLRSSASDVIAHENIVVTSEEREVNVYNIPNPSESDLITHKFSLTEIDNPKICLCNERETEVFAGSNLKNVCNFSLSEGKEIRNISSNISNHIKSQNIQETVSLSYLNVHSNDLLLGLSDVGFLFSVDMRSEHCQTINLKSDVNKWTYKSSVNGEKICLGNCIGEFYVFDKRNFSKEVLKLETSFDLLENEGNNLKVQFDPAATLVSVSGFDKCVKIFSISSSNKESPLFVHDGHAKKANYISGHLWHDTLVNVLFSYDDTGTMQAWKYKSSSNV